MISAAADLARRLARDAEAVCRHYLSRGRRSGRHLNARFGTADAPIIPAGPSGAPWHLTTRQFRRSIARHIANRPFGTIAGMIQYKYASVAAFEGYAGSSRSGFRAEVETERRLGQIEDILTPFR
jgi:hypothetical protein